MASSTIKGSLKIMGGHYHMAAFTHHEVVFQQDTLQSVESSVSIEVKVALLLFDGQPSSSGLALP
jgi:hypothetical protein